jgi:hypothetical protein
LVQVDQASQGRPYRLLAPNPDALVPLDNETQQVIQCWKGAM